MNKRIDILPEQFTHNPVYLWSKQTMLLTAGDFASGKFNTMTVGWGYIGQMWGKPSAFAVVRPQRYTKEFMEQYDSFTLSAFGEEYRSVLQLCGSKSGRDTDKIKEAGITPVASEKISAPGFQEAELILECKKVYRDEFRRDSFLNPLLPEKIYASGDLHIIYIGEIVRFNGTEKYRREI